MSVTAPEGVPGRRRRRRAQGQRRPRRRAGRQRRPGRHRGRRLHRQPGQGRAGAVEPAGAQGGVRARRRAQLRRRQRLHRPGRASRTPTPPPSTPPPRSPRQPAADRRRRRRRGLLHRADRRAAADGQAAARRATRRCAALPATAAPAAAEAIMTTDTRPKTTVVAGRAAGRSAAWPRAPACSPRAGHHALRAHHRRGGRRRRRWTRRCARPRRVTFDRLDSDGCMSTNDTVLLLASGASGIEPTAGGADRRGHRAPATTWPSSCSPTPRAPPRTSPSRCVGAAERGRRGRGGPVGRPQQPGQDRAVRQRPELGPDPRRGRHHRRRVRAGRASTWPSTASGSAAAAPPPRTGPRWTCPAGTSPSRIDLHAGADDGDRSGPTTCRTPTSTRTRRTRHEPCSARPATSASRWARRAR